jgi:hypothetical protein
MARGARLVRLRSRLARRRREIAVGLVLTGPSVWMMVDARERGAWGQGIEFGLAGNLIGALVILYFAEPLIRQAREAQVEVVPSLDFEWLLGSIQTSSHPVRIAETWTNLLRDTHREAFLAVLHEVLRRQVSVQILLLDPDSEGAAQRDREVEVDVPGEIRNNLRHLSRFRDEIVSRELPLEVRLCNTVPGLQLYQSGLHSHVAVFVTGMEANEAPQLRTRRSTSLGDYAGRYFDMVWNHDDSFPLDRYLHARLRAHGDEYRAEYVTFGGCWYLSHDVLDDLLGGFADVVTAQLIEPVRRTVSLTRVRSRDLPPQIRTISDQKYGPGRSYKVCAQPVDSQPAS